MQVDGPLLARYVVYVTPDYFAETELAIQAVEESSAMKMARLTRLAEARRALDAGMKRAVLTPAGKGFTDAVLGVFRVADAARAQLVNPEWMPARGPRRMRTVLKIAQYWAGRDPFTYISLDQPRCFGCRREAESWTGSYFDRAHLVDRWCGGLDHEPNVVPLCELCHRLMPSFDPGEGEAAKAWVVAGGSIPVLASLSASM